MDKHRVLSILARGPKSMPTEQGIFIATRVLKLFKV